MATPIETVLKQWLTPLLKEHRFRKKGKTYTREDEHGNRVFVHVDGTTFSDRDEYRFFFELGVCGASSVRYIRDVLDGFEASIHEGWWTRLKAPEPIEYGLPHSNIIEPTLWTLDTTDPERQALTGRLMKLTVEKWLPDLIRFADPLEFLAYLDSNEPRTPEYQSWSGPVGAHADLFLLLDAGPSARLDQAIAGVRDDPHVSTWLDQRVQ